MFPKKFIFLFFCLQILSLCSLFGQNRPLERAVETNELLRESAERSEEEEASSNEEQEQAIDAADPTPLGVALESIRLIAHQDRVEESPSFGGAGIQVESAINEPDNLRGILQSYLDRPLSMRLLAELSRDIIQAWRDNHYPLVDVYYPPQNITEGNIQIVVREAVLGEKSVEGARHSRSCYLLSQLRVVPGDRVNSEIVRKDLDWLNENPIRQVHLIYDRGDADGTSDMILEITEDNPLTFYGGLANTGLELTGENEWSFGVNWANPFQTEQAIGYHFTTDFDWESLESHSLIYQKYLPWRHIFQFLGAYVTSEANVPLAPGFPIGVNGVSRQASFEYRIPLGRLETNQKYRHYLTAAFDYKSTNTDILFGGSSLFGNELEVGQFRVQYDGSFPDDLGYTSFTLGLTGSPGDLFDNNTDFNFDLARLGSTADYWYGFGELERTVNLPRNFLFRYRGLAQFTDGRLNSTEQLLGGGYRTVRGFDESLVRGDSGLISNFELISPSFSVASLRNGVGDDEACDRWNSFWFYDAAILGVVDGNRFLETDSSLRSTGLGLTCRFGDCGFGRLSYGWALQSKGVAEEDQEDGKLHFGVSLRY